MNHRQHLELTDASVEHIQSVEILDGKQKTACRHRRCFQSVNVFLFTFDTSYNWAESTFPNIWRRNWILCDKHIPDNLRKSDKYKLAKLDARFKGKTL